MARIRSIKPEIWEDEAMERLSRDARLLFIGLITQADDEGRLKAKLLLLRSQIFPYDEDVTNQQMDAWLSELEQAGLIRRYAVDNFPYAALVGWSNQKINRPTPSKLPPPPRDPAPTTGSGSFTGHSVMPHADFTEASPLTRARIGSDQGSEGKGSVHTARAGASEFAAAVEDLWHLWPSNRRPIAAMQLADVIADEGVHDAKGVRQMIAAAEEDAAGPDWRENVIPNIDRWVRDRQWDRQLKTPGDETASRHKEILRMIPGGAP